MPISVRLIELTVAIQLGLSAALISLQWNKHFDDAVAIFGDQSATVFIVGSFVGGAAISIIVTLLATRAQSKIAWWLLLYAAYFGIVIELFLFVGDPGSFNEYFQVSLVGLLYWIITALGVATLILIVQVSTQAWVEKKWNAVDGLIAKPFPNVIFSIFALFVLMPIVQWVARPILGI